MNKYKKNKELKNNIGFKVLPFWARILVMIIAICDLMEGNIILGVIWICMGNWVGKINQEYALDIKRKTTIPYLIGFAFSLPGLLGYWIYYKIKIRKDKRIKNK